MPPLQPRQLRLQHPPLSPSRPSSASTFPRTRHKHRISSIPQLISSLTPCALLSTSSSFPLTPIKPDKPPRPLHPVIARLTNILARFSHSPKKNRLGPRLLGMRTYLPSRPTASLVISTTSHSEQFLPLVSAPQHRVSSATARLDVRPRAIGIFESMKSRCRVLGRLLGWLRALPWQQSGVGRARKTEEVTGMLRREGRD